MRPEVAFPVRNRFLIACETAALRLLATPIQSLQEIPDATRPIAHPKQFPDQVGNPIQGPVIFGVPVRIGAAGQGLERATLSSRRYITGPSGSTTRIWARDPAALGVSPPATHTLCRHPRALGDLDWRLPMSQQTEGPTPASGQLLGCTQGSH